MGKAERALLIALQRMMRAAGDGGVKVTIADRPDRYEVLEDGSESPWKFFKRDGSVVQPTEGGEPEARNEPEDIEVPAKGGGGEAGAPEGASGVRDAEDCLYVVTVPLRGSRGGARGLFGDSERLPDDPEARNEAIRERAREAAGGMMGIESVGPEGARLQFVGSKESGMDEVRRIFEEEFGLLVSDIKAEALAWD